MSTYLHKIIFSVLFCVLFSFSFMRAQPPLWLKQFGGGDGDIGLCTAADLSGNIYTTGTFTGTSNFGTYNITSNGKGDAFIMKASASTGEVEWVKQIGSVNEDNGNAIVCDQSGKIFATGRFSGSVVLGTFTLVASGAYDSFLACIDPFTGNYIWAKRLGGTGSDGGLAITCDGSSSIYSCGYFQGTAVFGTATLNPTGTNLNMYLLRTDVNSGSTVWVRGFGTAGYTYATALTCDITGDVYLTGHYESQLVMGSNTLLAIQYQDVFVSKHDGVTGSVLWANSIGGNGSDNGNGIAVNSAGDVFCAGKFENIATFGTATITAAGNSDIFVSKLDGSSGTVKSVKQIGAEGYEQVNALSIDASGKVYLTGQFSGIVNFDAFNLYSNGNADAFVAKLDPGSNSIIWATSSGGQSVDSGYGITVDAGGLMYCTGYFQSVASILGNTLTAKGSSDFFILKLQGTTVGLNDNRTSDIFQMYPNPCDDKLVFKPVGEKGISGELIISTLDGRVFKNIIIFGSEISLNTTEWIPGIYSVTFKQSGNRYETRKIIKN